MNSFKEKVLEVVRAIPKGKVYTYTQVAFLAGNGKASRAVGSYMSKNRDATVPCHRVVKATGEVGSYNGLRGTSKEGILREEGVPFVCEGRVVV
jgi:methylated-DNA-protein-cysteine methyltransferase related protein